MYFNFKKIHKTKAVFSKNLSDHMRPEGHSNKQYICK